MRFSNRRRIAESSCHGMFVAPKTRMLSASLPTPFIWTRNSVLMRRADSDSLSDRAPHSESTSSTKMIARGSARAISKRLLTRRSDSPIHFETRSDDDTEKNLQSASVATALARYDLPVPGGP
eukprot:Amastigsp_a680174_25.p3 type:complete len:123 gc:universal Amastigsp_a680174_25:946-578(-)